MPGRFLNRKLVLKDHKLANTRTDRELIEVIELKKKIIIVLFVAILIVLAVTNPNDRHFQKYYLMNETKYPSEEDLREQLVKVIDDYSIRKNYLIFSTYEFRFEQKEKGVIHKKYFAIFNSIYRTMNKSEKNN